MSGAQQRKSRNSAAAAASASNGGGGGGSVSVPTHPVVSLAAPARAPEPMPAAAFTPYSPSKSDPTPASKTLLVNEDPKKKSKPHVAMAHAQRLAPIVLCA
jgi:hypothetical protein